MLDVRRMKVLREVAACGSFSAAAESLNFTQSAISQHVAALERETGTQLVERGARGVRLTEAGARARERTRTRSLRGIDSAEEELAAIAGLRGGRLRLVCSRAPERRSCPRAVAAFHGRHPDVELSLREAEPDEAAVLLKAGDVDLALVYDHPATMLVPGLELTHLLDDCYDALLPAGHALAGRRRLSLADLSDDPWILSTSTCGCRQITEWTAMMPASSRAWRSRPTRPRGAGTGGRRRGRDAAAPALTAVHPAPCRAPSRTRRCAGSWPRA